MSTCAARRVGLSWQATDPEIVPVTIFCLTMAGFLGMGNKVSKEEKAVLEKLQGMLQLPQQDVDLILESVRDGALSLGSRVLEPLD